MSDAPDAKDSGGPSPRSLDEESKEVNAPPKLNEEKQIEPSRGGGAYERKEFFSDWTAEEVTLGDTNKLAFYGAVTCDAGTDACNLLDEEDVGVQVVEGVDAGCQVDVAQGTEIQQIKARQGESKSEEKEASNGDGDEQDEYDKEAKGVIDSGDLLPFLRRVVPGMLDELSSNLESQVRLSQTFMHCSI